MTELAHPDVKSLSINEVRPYWRNPRTISAEAIDKVKRSLEEFGYQQPIIVDTDGVIIAGHTRYAALRQLGVETVPVLVSQLPAEKAQEYRIIDNRSGEYSGWAEDELLLELREFETTLLDDFFPDIDLAAITEETAREVTGEDVDNAEAKVTQLRAQGAKPVVDITCPACYHEFSVESQSLETP